ncbi:MAG: hypothetical protein AAF610_04365 [Pseudomonadota bacterium]
MSSQWPKCPSCGKAQNGAERQARRGLGTNGHYVIATMLATVGALLYGGQIMRGIPSRGWLTVGMLLLALGAMWYVGVRLWMLVRSARK